MCLSAQNQCVTPIVLRKIQMSKKVQLTNIDIITTGSMLINSSILQNFSAKNTTYSAKLLEYASKLTRRNKKAMIYCMKCYLDIDRKMLNLKPDKF